VAPTRDEKILMNLSLFPMAAANGATSVPQYDTILVKSERAPAAAPRAAEFDRSPLTGRAIDFRRLLGR
jgi:hypothetical protein